MIVKSFKKGMRRKKAIKRQNKFKRHLPKNKMNDEFMKN